MAKEDRPEDTRSMKARQVERSSSLFKSNMEPALKHWRWRSIWFRRSNQVGGLARDGITKNGELGR